MGISTIYRISGSALNAQSRHLSLIANNMANAQTVSQTEAGTYRSVRPVFTEVKDNIMRPGGGVQLSGYDINREPVQRQLIPEHPMANEDGYIFLSNVNLVEEMMHMLEASRSYQSNIEVMNTAKDLMTKTLGLGN
jgi:flagellar basal-body rod protein FlgC